MARYKLVDRSPRFLPIVLESQLIAGSFEHALDVLVDTEVDLSRLAMRLCNDETGAPAYDPAVMLIVLLAHSQGVVSSRAIERLCRENVLFMAISGAKMAKAHGSGREQSVLLPVVKSTESLRTGQTLITADAGYHSEANLKGLYEPGVRALIADGLMRRRDERFANQSKYKALPDALWDKTAVAKESDAKFQPSELAYDPATGRCICPAGKKL